MKDYDIVRAAWWLHRWHPGYRELVSLPAERMADILGRQCHHPGRQYLAHGRDGDTSNYITCGTEVVWKTGGQDVCAYVLANAPAEDLDHLDYVEEFVWRGHALRLKAAGYDIPHRDAPAAWRDGQPLSLEAHQAIIDRMEAKYGSFSEEMAGALKDWR